MPLTAILSFPRFYIAAQRFIGADRPRRLSLEQLAHLRPGERVLDIGCGPAYILDDLPAVDYLGFDTDPDYIAYARRRYEGRGRFFCGQFDKARAAELGPFDAVILFGIIHHLNDVEASSLLRLLAQTLTPGGRVLTADGCFEPGQSWFRRLLLKNDRGKFVRDEPGYRRLAGPFADVQTKIIVCRIPYTILLMRLAVPPV